MARYRKKPVEIEAWQFTGALDGAPEWLLTAVEGKNVVLTLEGGSTLWINTLEGAMNAIVGDFIIQGVKGEIYPCKADIFQATYDDLEKPAEPQPKVLACDFDAVIAEYHGWKGDFDIGDPLPNVTVALRELQKQGWWICVWTTRSAEAVAEYCDRHKIPINSINEIPFRPYAGRPKIAANVYLDDRGMLFEGEWTEQLVCRILNFKTHWERDAETTEDFTPMPEE